MRPVNQDPQDLTPLYEQVAGEIRHAIESGEASPGDRLPPAKDLARVLGVNSNTALRALRILRDEGLLEFRQGRGVRVSPMAKRRSPVLSMARELVQLARRQGYSQDELLQMIRQVP
jgi:GntR family transcriptional regulator